jgi:hypothetical protein
VIEQLQQLPGVRTIPKYVASWLPIDVVVVSSGFLVTRDELRLLILC